MFFYVSLFIASLLVAFFAVYIFNALAGVGRAIHKAYLPNRKNNLSRHIKDVRYHSKVNDTPTPWGWKGSDPVTRASAPKGAAVNGATGLDGFVNKHSSESSSVGWPYREEKIETTGRAYKVSRRPGARKSGSSANVSQPWGW